jgi:hypothetical protein
MCRGVRRTTDVDDSSTGITAEQLNDFEQAIGAAHWVSQIRNTALDDIIPTCIDQNPCAHLRMPMDMIFHGRSMSLFQVSQQSATMSS